MKKVRFVFLVAVVAAVSAIGAGAAASAAPRVVGDVYVNDNTAGANTVAGFDRHADGTLTPIAGSPFAVGGAGTGQRLGSQGSLQLSADGRYLLAVDAGSNQISVLRIKPDGSLDAAEGSPVSSGGVEPVSIAVHGDLVYVANAGAGGSNYTGLHAQRRRPPARRSPARRSRCPTARSPATCSSTATATKLVGTRVSTSQIDSFTVGRDGLLTAAPGLARSPRRASARSAASSSPTNPTQLFVSNAHGGAGIGTVSAFADAADGDAHARSAPRRSPTTRPRRAGSRSATTASTCSPSTPPSRPSRATRSRRTAR